MQPNGSTRSSLKHDHLLQTPDTFIRSPLPGSKDVDFIIHAAPQIGARFTQMTAEMKNGGSLGPSPAQRFLYVLQGKLELKALGNKYTLTESGFAYLPQGMAHEVRAVKAARVAVIEKPYEALEGVAAPELVVGIEKDIKPVVLLGDEGLRGDLG